jgi:hypothetical protein
MMPRTYFKVNRAHLGEANVTIVVDGLMPIPPPGTKISITKTGEGNVTAEVMAVTIEIIDKPSMYEQTIFCNGRS